MSLIDAHPLGGEGGLGVSDEPHSFLDGFQHNNNSNIAPGRGSLIPSYSQVKTAPSTQINTSHARTPDLGGHHHHHIHHSSHMDFGRMGSQT